MAGSKEFSLEHSAIFLFARRGKYPSEHRHETRRQVCGSEWTFISHLYFFLMITSTF